MDGVKKKFYITTAIPYVNAAPHIGHALEFVQADVIARHHRLLGENVCLLSGGDENALKNVQAAECAGIPVQKFIDHNARLFIDLANKLEVTFDVFQKGSDNAHHYPSSQELWKLCALAGDIYTKSYEGLYCVGCEMFYTKEELDEHGECPEHPGKKLEIVSEKNYFFRLSKYQQELIQLITTNALLIIPEIRKNEVLSFLKQPLVDISISRTNSRAKNWGVPVPGDESQRIYVWFDALNIYQSGIGFGWNENLYDTWWPADLHVIGKGITRFHAVYWPAFLLSAKLPVPKSLFVHGYFTVNGRKMSKTIGNIIDPFALIIKYGADPLRYYFLREIPAYSDGDFSERRFKELYNADLANGLGNLIARIAKLSGKATFAHPKSTLTIRYNDMYYHSEHECYRNALNEFRFHDALAYIWEKIKEADRQVDENQPWKLSGEKLNRALNQLVPQIIVIATLLQPFLPLTSNTILMQFQSSTVKSQPPLFPRLT